MRGKRVELRDGRSMFYRVWEAEDPIATVHINHGMAEHSLRYNEFAESLAREGYTVYAQDHRGHGYTMEENEKGWFAPKDGWSIVIDDAHEIDELIAKLHPGIPHYVFGHSMGSFITRNCISRYPETHDAAIICGTGASQGIKGWAGKTLAKMRSCKDEGRKADEMLTNLSFGPYDKHFKGEGHNAWISLSQANRDAYDADPFCGFTCSSRFFVDLLELVKHANSQDEIDKVNKSLPMLIISGEDDPVGNYGNGVRKVYSCYSNAGIKNVRLKLYPGLRHEILNEESRAEVIKDILEFLKSVKA